VDVQDEESRAMTTSLSTAVINSKKNEARWLAKGFYFVSAVVIIDLVLRSIDPWEIGYRNWWDFYVVWEFASIAFTIVVTWVYWHKYINHGDSTAYADVLEHDHKKFHVFGLVIASAVLLIVAGLVAVGIAVGKRSKDFPIYELLAGEAGCLTFGVLCLVVAETMIIKAVPVAKQKADGRIAWLKSVLADLPADASGKNDTQQELDALEKKRADYDDILDDIAKALSFSDAPIGAAFLGIFLLVLAHLLEPIPLSICVSRYGLWQWPETP
jgi:hypothetical protein